MPEAQQERDILKAVKELRALKSSINNWVYSTYKIPMKMLRVGSYLHRV